MRLEALKALRKELNVLIRLQQHSENKAMNHAGQGTSWTRAAQKRDAQASELRELAADTLGLSTPPERYPDVAVHLYITEAGYQADILDGRTGRNVASQCRSFKGFHPGWYKPSVIKLAMATEILNALDRMEIL